MQTKNIIIALAALAVGVAAGWFAGGVGRARCPHRADGGDLGQVAPPTTGAYVANTMRKAPICLAESERMPPVELPVEKPKESAKERTADKGAGNDNPFPRYLDMFKNNPEALAAEFLKEAEKDRAYQRELRDGIIGELKLNEEQAAVFEKALDNLRDEIRQRYWERVDLITSGQLNDETAADGCIWDSNRILQYKTAGDVQALICNTAEKLYEQLELDGVSDANKQEFLFWAARQTSFSYECLEPNLQVYDKVYKNFGVGNGIFGWRNMQRQLNKK